jgi:spermidine synthase
VPKELFSLEALQEIRRVLKPDGVLTMNYVGPLSGPDAHGTFSVWRTLLEVFPHVAGFKQSPTVEDGVINTVFIASTLPIEFRDWVEEDYLTGDMRYFAFQHMHECRLPMPDAETLAKAQIVTDNENSLDDWQLPAALEHWKAMRAELPQSFWLNY